MRTAKEIADNPKITVVRSWPDGGMGFARVGRRYADAVSVVWSWNDGWDHVSVSLERRCPTWDEMCAVKDLFFYDEELCIEYHPKKSEYVNLHPYCLHIWRPQHGAIVVPEEMQG